MKVLNIISDKNIGGAGRCIINFLKYYDRKNFDITVVVPEGSLLVPEIKKLDTKVVEVNGIADKSLDMKSIGELKKLLKKKILMLYIHMVLFQEELLQNFVVKK